MIQLVWAPLGRYWAVCTMGKIWAVSTGDGRIGRGGAIPSSGQKARIMGSGTLIFVNVYAGHVFYMRVPHHRMPNPAAQGPMVGRPGREAVRAGGYFQQG